MLLAATSDYFKAMLCGRLKESSQNHVHLKGVTADVLENILNFLYSGSLRLDLSNLGDVLNAASHLQVTALLRLCSDYMISQLNGASDGERDVILELARTYYQTAVLRHHDDAILADFEHFSTTTPLLRLPAAQLSSCLASDALVVTSELSVFNAVASWYAHNPVDRGQHLEMLLGHVRYGLMTETELTLLTRHWLKSQHPACEQYIATGLKYHSDCLVGHPHLSCHSKVRVTHQSLVLMHQCSPYRPFEVTAHNEHDGNYYQLLTDSSGSRDCRIDVVSNLAYMCGIVDCGGGALVSSLMRFDPRHVRLQPLSPCRHLRFEPALAAVDGALFLFGGHTENRVVLDSVERYDVFNDTWRDLDSMPTPTHSLAASVHTGSIYLSGGMCNGDDEPTDALLRYEPEKRQWKSVTPMYCARRLHQMVTVGEHLFVLGGLGGPQHKNHIPVESYSPSSAQWTLLAPTLTGRSVGHFAEFKSGIVSLGREHSDAQEDDIWCYQPATDTWRPYAKYAKGRSLASATAVLLSVNFNDCRIGSTTIINDLSITTRGLHMHF